MVASEPLVPYRESLLPYEQGHRPVLPPPWSDLPGLDECDGGKCYLSAAGGSLGLDLSACPLPPALVALLESHNEAVWALSQMLSKQIWTHDRLLSWYSSQKRSADVDVEVGTDTSIDARMASEGVSFLDKFVSAIQCKAVSEENSSFVTFLTPSDFEASYSKLGESSNGIADIAPILLSFGSQSVLANILIMSRNATLNLYADAVPTSHRVSASEQNTSGGNSAKLGSFSLFTSSEDQKRLLDGIWTRAQNALVAGFQEATHAGPIMGEPVQGVIFSVDALSVHLTACLAACPGLTVAEVAAIFNVAPDSFVSPVSTLKEDGSDSRSSSLISSGQMISEVRNALRLCVLSCPVRIVEPVYACDLQCDQSQLGNLYAVLSKRRGEVTKEDIIDGTSLFILSATLPVSESFGFAQELLRKTSGNATAPQLVFSHWQTIEQDPFWRPSTEEEIEEYGDATGMERRNIFRVRIDKIRKRKGLAVEEKVVISAEKQRNMNKKK